MAKLALSAATLATVLLSWTTHAALPDPVRIDTGLISGIAGAGSDVRVFRGIPYAAPPVGTLRWRMPQPAAHWSGIRKADKFSAACMQVAQLHEGELPFSEDCLYLNVFTAAASAHERRPVMVWIFGGGMRVGNAGRPGFYGDALANKGVVVVTLNYRVGLMGSFAHPELTAESGHHSSGNYALLDMIAALQWVHRNITAFGGDPSNVTLFGQSSGAGSVDNLLASPLVKGLVHRAISESTGGTRLGRRTSTSLADAEQAGLQFAAKAGAKSLAELRAMPAAQLIKLEWNNLHNLDNWVQPLDLGPAFASHRQNDIPLLAGSNSDEGANTVNPVDAAKWTAEVKRTWGAQADGYLALYPSGSDPQAEKSQRNQARDLRAWLARELVRSQSRSGKAKTWLYFFSRNPAGVLDPSSEYPTLSKPGAAHAAEIAYVFNNLDAQNKPWQPWDHTLADMMSSYWVNFARSGDPNGPGLPAWPAYDAGKDVLMQFGDQVSVGLSPLKKVIDAVDPYNAGQ